MQVDLDDLWRDTRGTLDPILPRKPYPVLKVPPRCPLPAPRAAAAAAACRAPERGAAQVPHSPAPGARRGRAPPAHPSPAAGARAFASPLSDRASSAGSAAPSLDASSPAAAPRAAGARGREGREGREQQGLRQPLLGEQHP